MRLVADIKGDFKSIVSGEIDHLRRTANGALSDAARDLTTDLRISTARVLGYDVANAWRSFDAPGRVRDPLRGGALVYSKAPHIIAAFSRNTTIRPTGGGTYLAIPTENVPRVSRGGRRRPMTWDEVQAAFGQYLRVIPSKRPGVLVQVIDAVKSKTAKGWRKASAKRLATGRNLQTVVMFVLVRQVQLRKRIDLDEAAKRGDRYVMRRWVEHFNRRED